jgi:hypothetical protein
MNKWPFEVSYIQASEIAPAINNAEWQAFRISLKGISTPQKLIRLAQWPRRERADVVRIDNYINALKRGGQLNMDLEVIK